MVTVIVVTVMAGVMMTKSQAELQPASIALLVSSDHGKLISEATEPNIQSSSEYEGSGRLGGKT